MRRRVLRFSLKTLFCVVTVVAVVIGLWVPWNHRARRQKEAVDALSDRSVRIIYDYEVDTSGKLINKAEPPGPSWLRRYLGNEYWDDVVAVAYQPRLGKLIAKPVTDDDLRYFDAIPSVERLILRGNGVSGVSDDGLSHLSHLAALWQLDLSLNYKITGEGLRHLSQLTALRKLDLSRNHKITDEGLLHLSDLVLLEDLNLRGTGVTGAGIKHLANLRQLERLVLHERTQITDKNAAALRRLTNLSEIRAEFQLTDAGLRHLRGLTRLKELNLLNSSITDEGLTSMKGMRGLEKLYLTSYNPGAAITDVGIQNLRGLINLRWLVLNCPDVTGDVVGDLSNLVNLEGLGLQGIDIGDEQLEYVLKFKKLKHLDLKRTRVTSEGIAGLRSSLPNCEVVH